MANNPDSVPGSERSTSCRNVEEYIKKLFTNAAKLADSYLQIRRIVSMRLYALCDQV